MPDFKVKAIRSWDDFLATIRTLNGEWIFRGQREDWKLKSRLERSCEDYKIKLKKAPGIEYQLVRDFRRRYQGNDSQVVADDTLYCLALMQHHGAPTRLLDWTYSPYVAVFFALESSGQSGVVWCMEATWRIDQAKSIVGEKLLFSRYVDETRTDETFKKLYGETNQ